ncbi:MAG: hypothetical protein H6525_04615 [Actinobacteria bacterium]|nr:hypothetical protein [Actinomycetota bacterium]
MEVGVVMRGGGPGAARRRRGGVRAACAAVLALLTGSIGVVMPSSAAADPGVGQPLLSGWLPYWTTSSSLASYTANADLFANISPFWFDAQAGPTAGSVSIVAQPIGQSSAAAMAQLRAAGKKVLPAITDGTPRGYMAAVLQDPTTRAAHVEQLLELVRSGGFDGIDLDYEGFAFSDGTSTWNATKPAWAAFVTELAARFHANGLLVTAAVPTSPYWVYDFPTLGAVLDGVRVMTYDYSVARPGPIAPLDWVRRETQTMRTMIPSDKLIMGIPVYGRDWVRRTSTDQYDISLPDGRPATVADCPVGASFATRAVSAKDTYSVTAKPGATVTRNPVYGELQVRYSETLSGGGKTCVVNREAWLADPRSVDDRLRTVISAGASGAALWTVGGENSVQWETLRYFINSRGPIYWSPLTSGPYPVYGAILSRYQALGMESSILRLPTSAEMNAAVPGSRVNTFQGGRIYWSPATGAHEVYGAILGQYSSLGAETSVLGLPRTGELSGRVPGSRANVFARGAIYWSSTTGAHEVYGAILGRYWAMGGETSPLGLPTSGEVSGRVPGSRVNTFTGGAIYWSPATGAHDVYGAIYQTYQRLGAESSRLGLPVTGEVNGEVAGWRVSNFTGGAIYWSPAYGTWVVYR